MISSLLSPDQNLQGILSSLSRILTPTEKLPGNSPIAALLAQPHMMAPQYGQQLAATQQANHAQMPAPAQQGSAGSSGGSSPLSNASTLKNLYSAISSLLGPSAASLASGAAANGAATGALGTVGAQTAPEAASIQAANNAALGATNGGALGAGAGLLGTQGIGSGLAADSAVTGTLGGVGAQTVGESAAIQAANDAALSGTASGTAAGGGAAGSGSGAALGAGAGAATALGLAALPLALAAFVPTGENASWWQGLTNQINNPDPSTAFDGKLTLANDLLNNPGDNPYSQQQLQAWGIPSLMHGISQPITKPTPGGWLGGSARGMSRI